MRIANIIAAITDADTFLTSKQIREKIGVTGPANTGEYATIMAALPYVRQTGLILGQELYRRTSTEYFLKLYLYGLPSFYLDGKKANGFSAKYEDRLLSLIIEGEYYFQEGREFTRP